MNNQQAYRVLGIDEHSTPREAKIAYLKLVKRWHPDQFSSDDSLKPEAEELIRQINLAYEIVQSDISARHKPAAAGQETKAGNYCYFHSQPAGNKFVMVQQSASIYRHSLKLGSLKQAQSGWRVPIQTHPAEPNPVDVFDDVLSEIMKTDLADREPG